MSLNRETNFIFALPDTMQNSNRVSQKNLIQFFTALAQL